MGEQDHAEETQISKSLKIRSECSKFCEFLTTIFPICDKYIRNNLLIKMPNGVLGF